MAENEYRVIQIDETTVLDAAKNPVPGVRAWFTFGDGQSGHIDIPLAVLTPERRETMIQAYIDRIQAIWT